MDKQQTERLRALWKSGRDKYRSFFAVLNEVRQEIGDDALPAWCRTELFIGLSVITQIATVLGKIDEDVVRAELAAANKAEKDERAAAVAAARKAREDAARQRELEAAEHERKLAKIRAEKARKEVEHKKIVDTERHRQQQRRTQRGPKASADRRKREITTKISDAALSELVEKFKRAETQCAKGIDYWIAGSIAKAMVLCAARGKFTADREFGAWLTKNEISLSEQDRQALIGLGRLGEKRMREILTNTESRSYQLIWRDNKPTLKAVEN